MIDDNTRKYRCPTCKEWIVPFEKHLCSLPPQSQTIDIETKTLLERIAKALERIADALEAKP